MLQYIRDIFQTNNLKENKMQVNGKKVNLKNIDMPYLNIAAESDNLIPNESSTAIMDLVGSNDKELWIMPGGHVSFAYAPSSVEYWKKIDKWLSERD
jgi:polyhydroxyalkanoate synthase